MGLYVLQKTVGPRVKAPSDEVRVTAEFKVEDVHEIEIHRGKDAVSIRRDGTEWRLPGTFNSKGDKKKIDSFLETLRDLKGEPRGRGVDYHKEVGLDAEKALHVVLKGVGGKEIERLLVGKRAPGFDRSFARRASSEDVFIAHRNLLSLTGVEGTDEPPKPQAWLDLQVIELDRSKIEHVRLRGPATLYEFRREQKKKEELQQKENEKKEEEKKEYEWLQARQGVTYRAKKDGVERVLEALRSVRAEDVADPAKVSEYGFEAPQYEAVARLEDKKEVGIQIGKELADKKGKFYARATDQPTVFVVTQATVQSLFPKGRDLMDLPTPELPRGCHRIRFASAHRVIDMAFERTARFVDPPLKQAPRLAKIEAYAGRLSDFTPEDVSTVVDPREAGLDKPEHTVLFESQLGNLEIRVGGKAPGNRRFLSFSGEPHIFLIAESDLSTFAPTIREFLEYRPFKVDRDAIQEVHATVEGKPVRLVRRQAWECHLQGYPFTGVESGIDKYLDFLADLKPVEILNRLQVGEPTERIRYILDDETTLDLELGKAGDYYWVRGGGLVFQIEETHFKKPEVKLQDVCERLMLKKREAIESITLKTPSGEKALDKATLPELRVEDFAPADKRAESGVDQMKTVLTIKVREGRELRDLVLIFGEQPADRKDLRYMIVLGSDTVAFVKEELFQQITR